MTDIRQLIRLSSPAYPQLVTHWSVIPDSSTHQASIHPRPRPRSQLLDPWLGVVLVRQHVCVCLSGYFYLRHQSNLP